MGLLFPAAGAAQSRPNLQKDLLRPKLTGKTLADVVPPDVESSYVFDMPASSKGWKEFRKVIRFSTSDDLKSGKPFVIAVPHPTYLGQFLYPAIGQFFRNSFDYAVDSDGDGIFDLSVDNWYYPPWVFLTTPVTINSSDRRIDSLLQVDYALLQGSQTMNDTLKKKVDSLFQPILIDPDFPNRDLYYLQNGREFFLYQDGFEETANIFTDSLITRYEKRYGTLHPVLQLYRLQRLVEKREMLEVHLLAQSFYSQHFRFIPAKVYYLLYACPPDLFEFHKKKILQLHGNHWLVKAVDVENLVLKKASD